MCILELQHSMEWRLDIIIYLKRWHVHINTTEGKGVSVIKREKTKMPEGTYHVLTFILYRET